MSPARETVRRYPDLDVFALVGIQLPVDTFVAVAGATELLFGLEQRPVAGTV
jgi:hypothetical protein